MTLNGMHIVKVNINFLLKGHMYVVLKQRNKLQRVTNMAMYQKNVPIFIPNWKFVQASKNITLKNNIFEN